MPRVYLTGDSVDPEEQYYWLLGKNGLFAVKRGELLHASKKVDVAQVVIEEPEEFVRWTGRKIPRMVVLQAVNFFRKVAEKQGTESFAFLIYDLRCNEYRLAVPRQVASAAWVQTLEAASTQDGEVVAGSLHAHLCEAFHSSVDTVGEAKADGLHIVVGSVLSPSPQFSCCLVAFGQRHVCETGDVLENPFEVDREWLNKVQNR